MEAGRRYADFLQIIGIETYANIDLDFAIYNMHTQI